ncbi:MAG: anti-sigma factor [Bacteroidota bacterium]|nr:anti-sigma factor [Bacteroidota bacterium]MDP4195636.1 anti-sigma factor [Bacteroidota bacterium]
MDANKLKEILYAYSSGCLDAEDYPEFFKYLSSENGIMDKEFGNLQNVVALIPAILEIEHPNPKVKDKVARKLYRMKDESKAIKKPIVVNMNLQDDAGKMTKSQAVDEKSDQPISSKETGRDNIQDSSTQHSNLQDRKFSNYIPLSEAISPESRPEYGSDLVNKVQYNELQGSDIYDKAYDKAEGQEENRAMDLQAKETGAEFSRMPELNQIRPELVTENLYEEREKEKGSGKKAFVYFLGGILVSLVLSGGVYYKIDQELTKSKGETASLRLQLNSLRDELTRVERYQKVASILSSKETKQYNLEGTESNTKASGKLTISADGKEGVLQLYNMPLTKGKQAYQLWITSKDQTISMGTFNVKQDVEYYPLDQLPVEQSQISSFFVTLEDNGEAESPSKKVYLSGKVSLPGGSSSSSSALTVK